MPDQTAFQRYWPLIRHHGPIRGLRRVWERITQVDLYDWWHGIQTRQLLAGDEFVSQSAVSDPAAVSYYGPNFTAATRRPLIHLIDNYPILGSTRVAFLDFGCGRGKVLHVARRVLPRARIIGVDLVPSLLADARKNVPTAELIRSNVLEIDYRTLLKGADAVVAFNTNSFDRETTKATLEAIRGSAPAVFYVYSNPVYEDLLAGDTCVFAMRGWHKNWNAKAFVLKTN